ncbi:putative phospholipid ABC transporter-binding protein MlaD [Nocardioides dokdonensis FR1436]|uniref:Putative phospholipid ABC transporter-binding protein MlaD n=1 Tax=Nocardioides dokdonensis FR1436 TaxID=1300347 RepID=A0A1A9GQH1_9ACTN|nr:MCE family protein [Nocardioides dokdonensis]ANH39910.1 putative phospholipid ABC transporter-binding protein MlaD [Nocardioides dokdonensis FR1436]
MRAVRLLAGALAGALLLTACDFDGAYDLPLPGSPVDADSSFEVRAQFDDVLSVVPRSPVKVDDVTVGEVVDIERDGWTALVTLRVRDDVVLPDNALADIRQVSLLGEKYVALLEPTDTQPTGRLGDGDDIVLADTGRNPEVEEVLGALSYLLSGGGVAQLGTITHELNNVMSGRTGDLRTLLGDLEDVVGTLDDQKAEIIGAMESLANLTATLNKEKRTITGALDVAGPAVEVLADQHDELVGMLRSLDELGEVGTEVIGASKDDILASLRSLRPVLDKLTEAGDALAPGLNLLVSFPFPKEASEIVKGDYANTSIRLDISLENLVPGGGLLPPVDLPDPLETVGAVLTCLQSGALTSKACLKVLKDADLLQQLKKKCTRPAHEEKPVCRILNQLPDVPGLPDLPGILDDLLPGLPGILGGGRADADRSHDLADLLGGRA